jgi:hypothetical protein
MKKKEIVNKIVSLPSSYSKTKYEIHSADRKWADKWNTYEFNSLKLRSPEILECADMVIAGCSFSYGVGVPEQMSWGVQVANSLNLNYHNLSYPGKGAPYIIDNLFSYFKKYGNPKILVCLFPEPTRMQVLSPSDHMVSERFFIEGSGSYLQHLKKSLESFPVTLSQGYDNYPEFSKRPHMAEDIMPIEMAMGLTFESIRYLEMYCKAAGIKLFWSFWDIWTEKYLNIGNHDYMNYINTNQFDWHSQEKDMYFDRLHPEIGESCNSHGPCKEYIDCHSHLREIYKENWDVSSDLEDGGPLHHWGIHRHTHIAEDFLKEINDRL